VNGPVLVVGSYPPIPRQAAAVSVAEVRAGWQDGCDLTAPIYGVLAGHRLDGVRRLTGASRLVLVVEDGFPLRPGPAALRQLTASGLIRAFRRFERVKVVVVGPAAPPVGRLLAAADEVVSVPSDGVPPTGVTPLGPIDTGIGERAEHLARALARRLPEGTAATVKRYAGRLSRGVRAPGGAH
jgi:hypothetical protein